MAKYGHLNKKTIKLLSLTDGERIEMLAQPKWIGYTRANAILRNLEMLLKHPKTHRMPNMLIVGRTNNGKTMIVNRFVRKHPAYQNPDGNTITIPALIIQAPPVPDENRFYNIILHKLLTPYRAKDHVSRKQVQVLTLLESVNLKILIIDEIHHILAGHIDKQRQFLNVIKYMGNELQIPIVGVGTKDAFRALQTDPQLSNRFNPEPLPKWKNGMETLRLLASFERLLPLKKPSHLSKEPLASKIIHMAEGSIGEISTLLNQASNIAIETGEERINKKVLDATNWVAPSDRKRMAEQFL